MTLLRLSWDADHGRLVDWLHSQRIRAVRRVVGRACSACGQWVAVRHARYPSTFAPTDGVMRMHMQIQCCRAPPLLSSDPQESEEASGCQRLMTWRRRSPKHGIGAAGPWIQDPPDPPSLSYTHAHTGDVFGDLVRDALSGQALAKVVHKIALGCAGERAG